MFTLKAVIFITAQIQRAGKTSCRMWLSPPGGALWDEKQTSDIPAQN